MGSEVIKRYFDPKKPDIFEMVKKDLEFLIDIIIDSGFEYDLQIRENYFNLYYRGNSLAKVTPKHDHKYKIRIHEKFFFKDDNDDPDLRKRDRLDRLERFKQINPDQQGNYICFDITGNLLHSFFQKKHLKEFGSNIKKVNYQEEIAFEQMLITDNVNRPDFIIIDRQVMDHTSNQRMDLLALKREKGNNYQFCVVEVKLGNNPELNPDLPQNVIEQLEGYIDRIKNNFPPYEKCYKKTVRQKQELGLINEKLRINIEKGVSGIVVVGGYSGIVEKNKYIERLKLKAPDNIKIHHLKKLIDLSEIG